MILVRHVAWTGRDHALTRCEGHCDTTYNASARSCKACTATNALSDTRRTPVAEAQMLPVSKQTHCLADGFVWMVNGLRIVSAELSCAPGVPQLMCRLQRTASSAVDILLRFRED